jgi:hypothetical protein
MKQIFLMLCVTLGVTAFAQDKPAEVKPNPNAPKIKFAQEAFDFGTVVEGPQATHEFKFKNEGKEPSNSYLTLKLVVDVLCLLGLKSLFLPGKESVITATYNTQGRVGAIYQNHYYRIECRWWQ